MGSPSHEPERSSDETQHRVTLTWPLYMAKTPVTQAQYKALIGKNPSYFDKAGDEAPVESVSWEEAVDYCNVLSKKEGLEPAYDGNRHWLGYGSKGYRLPTEAEWEYACRAGTTTAFWTGANLTTEQANYDGENPMPGQKKGKRRGTTTPVLTFPPNPWGLHDMHGNVWEWCWDRYGSYPEGAATDPVGVSKDEERRVVRGGSWGRFALGCRSAYRLRFEPGGRNDLLGFRPSRSP